MDQLTWWSSLNYFQAWLDPEALFMFSGVCLSISWVQLSVLAPFSGGLSLCIEKDGFWQLWPPVPAWERAPLSQKLQEESQD